jgi:hypothetical protein
MMRDHTEPSRTAFLGTHSLVVYACDALPGFMHADKQKMLALAATAGSVAVLAELMDVRGCTGLNDLNGQVCSAAAAHGKLEALVWLRGRGCSWSTRVCASAAGGGHLKVLRYAHKHGCPWDQDTCSLAADGGHLKVLQYARDHGCPEGSASDEDDFVEDWRDGEYEYDFDAGEDAYDDDDFDEDWREGGDYQVDGEYEAILAEILARCTATVCKSPRRR